MTGSSSAALYTYLISQRCRCIVIDNLIILHVHSHLLVLLHSEYTTIVGLWSFKLEVSVFFHL